MTIIPLIATPFTFFEREILNSINLEDRNTNEPNDIKDVLSEVIAIAESESVNAYNINRYGSYLGALTNWLQGLPSALTVNWSNYDILQGAKAYGYIFDSEEEEDKFLETYFENCAKALITLDENY